jgi:hypothetical protein
VDEFKAGKKSTVFPNAPAGFSYPSQSADGSGASDFQGHSGIPAKWGKFAPRVGLAFDPTGSGRTSIRASYGISYDTIELQSLLNSNNVSPWAADIIHRNGTLDNPWQGLAGGNPFPFDWQKTPLFAPGSVFIPFNRDLDQTYVQTWNLAIQHQVGGRWLASASYMGNQGVRLWNTTAVNPSLTLTPQTHPQLFTGPTTCVIEGVTYGECNGLNNINQRRELRLWASTTNPARLADAALFSNIDEYRSDSTSSYNALLLSFRGEVGGVNLNANHTWSHCISDRVNVGVSNPNQTFHRDRDRSNCQSDRRHIFNVTAVRETPRFENTALRTLASDWRFSVIYRVTTGEPLTITSGADWARTGLAEQTADQRRADVYSDTSGNLGTQFWDRTAFAAPVAGSYGNMQRFSVRGFRMSDLDVAVSRVFNVTEGQRFEVRAEAFNVPNAVRPMNPTANITSSNFGRITNVRPPRIMQFALKYVF